MSQHGAVHGLLVHVLHGLAGGEVQAVHVGGIVGHSDVAGGLFYPQNGLKHIAGAVLNELAEGVQVGGEVAGDREQALAVLALGLCHQLLVPLAELGQSGLIVGQNFHGLALHQHDEADSGILHGVVGEQVGVVVLFTGGTVAVHDLVNVHAAGSHGQQAHCGQAGEPSAGGVGHHEGLIALGHGHAAQRALLGIGGGVDALLGTLFAVLLLQLLLEDAESNSGLGGGAGLGDDVDGEVTVADDLEQAVHIGGADVVACEVDLNAAVALGELVVEGAADKFQAGAGAQIRTADTDGDQNLGLRLNLLSSSLDALELAGSKLGGGSVQVQPAQEVAAGALFAHQIGISGVHQELGLLQLMVAQAGILDIQRDRHGSCSSFE